MILPLLAAVAAAWLALLLAAPVLPTPVSALTYVVGASICHQISERSFHLSGFQLPVCARCLGIYAGAAVALSGSLVVKPVTSGRLRGLTPRTLLVIGAVPTVVTLVLEWAGVWRVPNAARAAAGVILGAACAVVVASALATLHYNDECVRRRPTATSPPPPPRRT